MDLTENRAAFNRFLLELPAKPLATGSLEKDVHPFARAGIHQAHPTRIGDVDWCDPSKEQRSNERRDEGYSSRVLVCDGVCTPDLVRGFYN